MNIAYLILAHNTPKHLQRLINALSSRSSSFFIHLDKKSNADDFIEIHGRNIHFISDRVAVFWGEFSQVEAILILLRTALADKYNFDRFVLLSGSDYPLRSASYIEAFFERNPNTEFMNMVAMPADSIGKPISRLTTYRLRSQASPISSVIRKILTRVITLLYKRDYKFYFGDFTPYGGSTWWALSREACIFILTFVEKEIQLVNFFKNTLCPDESFFQTILGNSIFRLRIVKNITYTAGYPGKYTRWGGGRMVAEKHLAYFFSALPFITSGVFGNGEKLFARKFADESEDLVAKIKNQISEQEARLTNRCR